LTYKKKMIELAKITWNFMQTPAYKPYLTPKGLVWMVTEDPYTDPKYGEPDARRWSIYRGVYKGPDVSVSLSHPHLGGQVYFDTPEAAQIKLDAYAAKQKGWKIIPKENDGTTRTDSEASVHAGSSVCELRLGS
jgi:hypothetical protein